ncbi:YutD-like domain-containing protein [Paenibacillus alkalitolerans]|uniref:YutD-like domain-containing protein n=1 Tax=Paenibacillus alkalitolerans TaxID=2799335 RepID=UPI0018F41BDA|nr:YutD-like domain-containing protein [Paenibacillus alkalitolerans]
MILIGEKTYELILEHKNAWNADAFKERYSEVLDRYDYIVGDWGYNQLRLKGFFREGSPKSTKDTSIGGLQDYLQEYCNFGCAYFVLERTANKAGGVPPVAEPVQAVPESAEEDGAVDAEPQEGRGYTAGLAGGQAFSDRRPYSWREHQSPSRHSGRNGGERKDASADAAGDVGGVKAEPERAAGAGPRGRERNEESPRLHGAYQRQNDGKGRQNEEGSAGRDRFSNRGGARNPVPNGDGGGDRGEKAHRGGGFRPHHKGPKHNAHNRNRGPGGGGGQGARAEGGGQRGAAGNRPDGRGRPDGDGGNRHSQRGGQHRASAAPQPRNN